MEKLFVIQSPSQGVFMGWEWPYEHGRRPRFSVKAKLTEGRRYATREEADRDLVPLKKHGRGRKAFIQELSLMEIRPPAKQTTNFKRRGVPPPAGAITTPQPKPTGLTSTLDPIKLEGSTVEVANRYGVTLILECDGALHATLIASALIDGLVHFKTRCD